MANITVRNLPDQTKESLRILAAKSGISLEAYARHLLQNAANQNDFQSTDLLGLIDHYFGSENDVELDIPARSSCRPVVRFD